MIPAHTPTLMMRAVSGLPSIDDEIIRVALNLLAQRYACLRNNEIARRFLETGIR